MLGESDLKGPHAMEPSAYISQSAMSYSNQDNDELLENGTALSDIRKVEFGEPLVQPPKVHK